MRVSLAADGTLASVYDKRAEREVLDGPGNQLWAYVDKPREWDAWDLDEGYLDQGEPLPAAQAVTVAEDGPHRAAIRDRARVPRLDGDPGGPPVGGLGADRLQDHARLARPPLPAEGALPARRPLPARDVRDRVRRHGAPDAPQHELGAGPLRGLRAPVRRPVRARLRRGAAQRRPLRPPRPAPSWASRCCARRSGPTRWPTRASRRSSTRSSRTPGGWLEGGVLAEAEDLNRPLLARPVSGAEASLRPLARRRACRWRWAP